MPLAAPSGLIHCRESHATAEAVPEYRLHPLRFSEGVWAKKGPKHEQGKRTLSADSAHADFE